MPMKEDRRGYGSAGSGNRSIPKGSDNFFRLGSWKAHCDQCYVVRHAEAMFLRWDNARVCERCIEIRNPQDFVKGVPDGQAPPWTRPTPPPIFATGATGTTADNANETINTQIVNGDMLG